MQLLPPSPEQFARRQRLQLPVRVRKSYKQIVHRSCTAALAAAATAATAVALVCQQGNKTIKLIQAHISLGLGSCITKACAGLRGAKLFCYLVRRRKGFCRLRMCYNLMTGDSIVVVVVVVVVVVATAVAVAIAAAIGAVAGPLSRDSIRWFQASNRRALKIIEFGLKLLATHTGCWPRLMLT